MSKPKLRIKGEIIAYIILLAVNLWFFLINFINIEESISYKFNTQTAVSCIILILCIIWGIANLMRFRKHSK